MKNILMTGASGFIGQALSKYLVANNYHVTEAVRRSKKTEEISSNLVKRLNIGDISLDIDRKEQLNAIDCIIHLAGRAHVNNDASEDPLLEFRKVNTAGTLNLANSAVAAGVKRFIFLSSIGVNGNQSDTPFTEQDTPNPVEWYAISKLEAEIGLKEIAKTSNMDVVIIRPPLVYGMNAPGNFSKLWKAVMKGLPLPLGAIHNKRSFIAIDNLVDLIKTCIQHPNAAGQTFLASDDNDLSTTEFIKLIANSAKKPIRLLPMPASLIKIMASILGKSAMAQRLCGSLQIDISHTKKTLDWCPPVSVKAALQKIAERNKQK